MSDSKSDWKIVNQLRAVGSAAKTTIDVAKKAAEVGGAIAENVIDAAVVAASRNDEKKPEPTTKAGKLVDKAIQAGSDIKSKRQ